MPDLTHDVLVRFGADWQNVPSPQPFSNDTTNDSLDNDLVLSSSEQSLVLQVTEQQFVDLLSAALNGANRSYPSNYIEVIWPLVKAGKLSFCIEVANCIDTSSDVAEAIANALVNNTIINEALQEVLQNYGSGLGGDAPVKLPSSQTGENLLPSGYTCDVDSLCGMARWIVTNLHDGTTQLLAQLETATNEFELLSVFVDNVEGVSWFGSVLEFIAWIQDQLIEYYDASYSATVEDTLTCYVFCQIEPSCEVTLDGVISAYENAVLDTFTLPTALDTINDLWNWLDALDYSTASALAVVSSFHYAILQALSFGTNALKFFAGIRSFKQMIATGEDETDTYCDANCSCSSGWCYEQDFINDGLGDWIIHTVSGTPIGTLTANGVEAVAYNSRAQTQIDLFASSAYVWKNIEIEYERSGAAGSAFDDERIFIENSGGTGTVQIASRSGITDNGTIVQCFQTSNTTSRDAIRVLLRGASSSDTITITRVRVFGDGTIPSGLTDSGCDPTCS